MSLPRIARRTSSSVLSGSSCCAASSSSSSTIVTPAGPSALASSHELNRRSFSTSSSANAKPRKGRTDPNAPYNIRKLKPFGYDDVTTIGHETLQLNREFLRMFRLVELELPKLAEFKQAFVPPVSSDYHNIVKLRFVHHQGQVHPENKKCVLTLDIGPLFSHPAQPLPTAAAKHKFLLLAGERYDPHAGLKEARDRVRVSTHQPKDDGPASSALNGSDRRMPEARLSDEQEADLEKNWLGQIKIGSERFPTQVMNARWCLDTLQKLIEEANVNPEAYAAVPLDPRSSLAREARKPQLGRSDAVSIRDFPREWL
ncbi:37S ribosomal protein S24, mitochondrial [Tilletia horrida]|nr:37S ribosomal protein S24, mitochondrial [Tilletia horrida]